MDMSHHPLPTRHYITIHTDDEGDCCIAHLTGPEVQAMQSAAATAGDALLAASCALCFGDLPVIAEAYIHGQWRPVGPKFYAYIWIDGEDVEISDGRMIDDLARDTRAVPGATASRVRTEDGVVLVSA